MGVYETYSKRKRKRDQAGQPDVYQYETIPEPLRVQIVHMWDEAIGQTVQHNMVRQTQDRVWKRIHNTLLKELGLFSLTDRRCDFAEEECKYFVLETSTDGVLDVVELSFKTIQKRAQITTSAQVPSVKADDAIEELNYRFREHGVGYQFVEGEIVRVDSQYIHAEAVKPALSLLNTAGFQNASSEFLKAHEHYRKGRFSEAMTEALKAFESTMKYICEENGWSYSESDTAKPLIKTVLNNELVPKYMETHLAGVRQSLEAGLPVVRNKNSSHGQGSQEREIPDYMAAYALHLAATNIVFFVEANQSKS